MRENYKSMSLRVSRNDGYTATFNPTFPVKPYYEFGWVSPYHFGLNQRPIVLMIENYRS
ncbi:MAG: glucoamylase family protein [Nitrosospira sp.]